MSKSFANLLNNIATPLTIVDRDLGNTIRTIGLTLIGQSVGGPVGGAIGASLGSALAKAFPAPVPRPPTTQVAIKSPTPPRISAYGRLRLFWAWILYETAEDGWAIDVGVFHDGRLDAIETYYISDKTVTLLAGGWVQKGPAGEWGNNDSVRVGVRLGLPTETAFSEVIAKLPGIWTTNHRGDGCATGFMLSKNVKAENFQTIYALGGPNNATVSIVARAQRVFDWREGAQSALDPLTWTWSENAILHLAHYLLVRMGKSWSTHFLPTIAWWTAAANDADIAMPLKAGGTEPRYRSCLAHKHTDAHKDVINSLLGCADAWLSPRADGALVVYSGRYQAPTVTIGPDEIVAYSMQEGVDEESAVNTIKITYVSSAHDFNTVDTTDLVDEDDITARGKVLSDAIENPVPSHAQAGRLAKRAMARVNAPQRGTTTTNAAGRTALGQRYIRQKLIEAGTTFQDAVVEITKLTRNLQTGGLTYEWVLADPDIDEWDPATEEGEPAPVGERVAAEPLPTPVVTSALYIGSESSGEGTAGARVEIHASGPDREDLTWRARWRSDGGIWSGDLEYSDADPGPAVELITDFVPVGADVDVQVRYIGGDGRYSDWSASKRVVTGSITFDSTEWKFDSTSVTFDRT